MRPAWTTSKSREGINNEKGSCLSHSARLSPKSANHCMGSSLMAHTLVRSLHEAMCIHSLHECIEPTGPLMLSEQCFIHGNTLPEMVHPNSMCTAPSVMSGQLQCKTPCSTSQSAKVLGRVQTPGYAILTVMKRHPWSAQECRRALAPQLWQKTKVVVTCVNPTVLKYPHEA